MTSLEKGILDPGGFPYDRNPEQLTWGSEKQNDLKGQKYKIGELQKR